MLLLSTEKTEFLFSFLFSIPCFSVLPVASSVDGASLVLVVLVAGGEDGVEQSGRDAAAERGTHPQLRRRRPHGRHHDSRVCITTGSRGNLSSCWENLLMWPLNAELNAMCTSQRCLRCHSAAHFRNGPGRPHWRIQSCSFQAILSKFWAQPPPVKPPLGPLTNILDPPLCVQW